MRNTSYHEVRYMPDNISEHKVHLVSHVKGVHHVFPGTVLEAYTSSAGLYDDTLSGYSICSLKPISNKIYDFTHNNAELLTCKSMVKTFYFNIHSVTGQWHLFNYHKYLLRPTTSTIYKSTHNDAVIDSYKITIKLHHITSILMLCNRKWQFIISS